MKKVLAMILAALLAVSMLTACGGGGKDDPNVGVYNLDTMAGMTMDELEELLGEDMSEMLIIELKAGGKGSMTVEGEEGNIKWEMDGDNITISDSSDELKGTLVDGTLTLDFDGEECTFVKAE